MVENHQFAIDLLQEMVHKLSVDTQDIVCSVGGDQGDHWREMLYLQRAHNQDGTKVVVFTDELKERAEQYQNVLLGVLAEYGILVDLGQLQDQGYSTDFV